VAWACETVVSYFHGSAPLWNHDFKNSCLGDRS